MLTGTGIYSGDRMTTTTHARPTRVLDVHDWLDRANKPARGFTPSLCEYVPRHRAEAALES